MTERDDKSQSNRMTGFYNGFNTREEMEAANRKFSAEMRAEMAAEDHRRQARKEKGVPALEVLVEVAHGGSGQCHHIRRFLLALYNGDTWPLDMTRLRGLDANLQQAVLDVIELDWCGQEVHTYLDNGDGIFKAFWEREKPDDT